MKFKFLLSALVLVSLVATGENSVVRFSEPFESEWHEKTVPRTYSIQMDSAAAQRFRKIFEKVGVPPFASFQSKADKPHVFMTAQNVLVFYSQVIPNEGVRAYVSIYEADLPDGKVKVYTYDSKKFIKVDLSTEESKRLDDVFDIKPEERRTLDYAEKLQLQKYFSDNDGFLEMICDYDDSKVPSCSVYLRIDKAILVPSPFPPKIPRGELIKNEGHYSYLDEENRLQWALPFDDSEGRSVLVVNDIESARNACGAIGYSLPSAEHLLEGAVTVDGKENQAKAYWPKLTKTIKAPMSLGRFFTEGHAKIRLEPGQTLIVDLLTRSKLQIAWNQAPQLLVEVVCVRSITPPRGKLKR